MTHYALFLYDSLQPCPVDSLDDIIFILKAVVHSLEVISALFVIFAGLREFFVDGSWSPMNIAMLSVHSYFNVWLRIKGGWQKFLLRQVNERGKEKKKVFQQMFTFRGVSSFLSPPWLASPHCQMQRSLS